MRPMRLNTFPVPKGLRRKNILLALPHYGLNTFPVPKGLRPFTAAMINNANKFEHFPCSEGIKTVHADKLCHEIKIFMVTLIFIIKFSI